MACLITLKVIKIESLSSAVFEKCEKLIHLAFGLPVIIKQTL